MCSWPSTPVETVAQAGSSISHCSSGPLVVDTSDLEVSAVIPHSDPSLKLESAPSIPQNSVSWEPQCRKLFRSFSMSSATLGHGVH
ncbi:hypothetical protein M405DRAFT_814160 [Rhizopogon salebrosus TDB-379]|nr:hypothetical protein M405DRAFT_814160 [Rhizopogon salebrosus TDB-379]